MTNAPPSGPLGHDTAVAFSTDHMPLAAYLHGNGHMASLLKSEAGRVLFLFPASPTLQRDVDAFHTGAALVSPAVYDAARLALRREMDALLRSSGR
jgi:hypothetical protein